MSVHPSPRTRILIAVAVGLALATAACTQPEPEGELSFTGPTDLLLNAAALEGLTFAVEASDELTVDDLHILHGDVEANHIEREPQRLTWIPSDLEDGEHTVTVVRPRDDDEPEVLQTWTVTVDATPPELTVTDPATAVVAGASFLLIGESEPGATVAVGDVEVTVDEDGAFELEVPETTGDPVQLAATDAAGNVAETEHELLTVPSRVEVENLRGVHLTQHGWHHSGLREGILRLIDEGKVNTVVLTLKDESGRVGYTSDVPLAIESGANQNVIDLDETVAELHERGVHVVGRIVAFRDPVLGEYALENGSTDWLIQTPSGEPYTGRYPCCFTNFANPEVIDYHLALAEEAAAAGVDVVLWDYIRRPDGPLENLVIEGLEGTPEEAIVDFTRQAAERIAPYGTGHGVSVYGIAATRSTQIAQDVPGMAEHVDIIAPMVYPSHWNPGEYDVADPTRQPYDIVYRSLEEFLGFVEGTRARVVPWLEDSNYRAWDRRTQVRDQIRAAAERGVDEFMMWDPSVRYTPDAYEPRD